MRVIKLGCVICWALGVFLLMPALTFAKTPFEEFGVVRQKCSVCHKLDQQGRVEVIEETRKTPEEWKVVTDRMIRINGAPISDKDFYPVIKELSQHLILTPAEMAEVAYLNSDENSQYREIPKNETEERIFGACVRCHTYGKIRSHRKTREQWLENMNLHLGYYPTVVPQMREMDWPKEAMALVDVLAEMLPMDTAEWRSWMENRKDADLAGNWTVAGFQPGMGYYEGTYTFRANPQKGEDEYLVEKEVRYLNGTMLKLGGEGTLYGEYHLRYALAPTPLTGRIEGVFDLDAASMGFEGKWWTVVQDTNAYGNEAFYKVDGSARVFAIFPQALRANGAEQTLTLIGVNLPANLSAADIRFANADVKVMDIESPENGILQIEVLASQNAAIGPSGLNVNGVSCDESVIVYNKFDGIRIFPALGRARVSSGAAYPPHGVQFVARGVNYGPDGKPETADDLILDAVDAEWWLEEEKTRDNDDDLKYLQTGVVNGLYTPVTTYGPIETRFQRREGVGLIAIGAAYTDGGQEFKARSLLGVTVPDFITHIK
ncbi:MAG: quinohemoprotein amine dehydrogenase subunit alpha [Desulfobacterales bacterium]|nr:MAG: quinohemoprotein amine dehydrogenase subunit alpha [Desulfobacterales bacterium]